MAAHLIAQAFPASDVFDSLLTEHVAPQARRQQQLKLWTFNQSLFAQVAKADEEIFMPYGPGWTWPWQAKAALQKLSCQ